jgi:hypothetical protein
MKSFLLFLLVFVIGAVVGALGGGMLGTGVGAGVGIVTGLKAGACLTLEAAREQGLITAEQETGLLQAAARQFASENLPDGPDTSEIDCAAVVAELRSAAQ